VQFNYSLIGGEEKAKIVATITKNLRAKMQLLKLPDKPAY
jgi:hypothetical protein